MKKLKYLKILIIIFCIFSISNIFTRTKAAVITNIYSSNNPNEVCSDVTAGKIKIGVHRYYHEEDESPDVMFVSTNTCSNSTYYNENVKGKTPGEDYPTFVAFGRSNTNYSQYIEGIEATDNNKYRYFFISNKFQAYNSDNVITQTTTLKAGESIFLDIDVSDKNVNINDYNDLRISLVYGQQSSDISISLYNSIAYYVIDTDNNTYGPFNLSETEMLKRLLYINSTSSFYINQYRLVSENILTSNTIPSDTIISKIRIVPYENYPIQTGTFRVYSFSIDAYTDTFVNDKEYITTSTPANKVRQNITNNMATNGTVKWSVSTDRDLKYYCSLCKGIPRTFSGDKIFYGQAYVNNLNATTYSLLDQTIDDNGLKRYDIAKFYKNDETSSKGNIMTKGSETTNPLYVYEPNETSNANATRAEELATYDYVPNKASGYFIGQDCSSSTFYAVAKELPYVDSLAGSTRYIYNSQTRLLGLMETDFSELEAVLRDNNIVANNERITLDILRTYFPSYFKNKYTQEDIFNGYGLLKPGDIVATDGHVRMETGYPHVECNDGTVTDRYTSNFCNNHGGIDGTKSYVIISEVRGLHVNMSKNSTEVSTHVTQEDAGWTMVPDSSVTDITDVDSLYQSGNTKITSFRFNKKYDFATLYGNESPPFDPDTGIEIEEGPQFYLPYRYVALDRVLNTNKIEKTKITYVLDKDDYSLEERNEALNKYTRSDNKLKGYIISNYLIDKIKIQINNDKYYIYPNQTNTFSLYYDLVDPDVLEHLGVLDYNSKNTITVSVYSGPNIDEVKESLNLDSEGFIEVVQFETSKLKPTLSMLETVNLNYGENQTIEYNYDGDGVVSCNSSNKSVVNCTVDNNTKKIVLEPLDRGSAEITVSAAEGANYLASINKIINIQVTKEYSLTEILTNNNYVITDNYAYGFELGATINSILNILNDESIDIETTTEIISTGTIIKKSNESIAVVIKGDLNGDGKINSGDLLQMRRYLLEQISLTGPYKLAGIIESPNEIRSLDLLRLRQFLLGKYIIR